MKNNTDETIICCGRPMERTDMGRVWESACRICGDVVYVKKDVPKPELLDD